jgi:hypothetical protein
MANRAFLLFVFTTLLAGMAYADDSAKLPSNKASVVLPLLGKLSSTSPPKLDEIEKILGQPGAEISNAGALHINYKLDDNTDVNVVIHDLPNHEVIAIVVIGPGKKEEVLYAQPLKVSK